MAVHARSPSPGAVPRPAIVWMPHMLSVSNSLLSAAPVRTLKFQSCAAQSPGATLTITMALNFMLPAGCPVHRTRCNCIDEHTGWLSKISFWDAMIVHAARLAGAAVLYSEDLARRSAESGCRIRSKVRRLPRRSSTRFGALFADFAANGFRDACAEAFYLSQVGAFHHNAGQRFGARKTD
jgi:hypothetical protein